MTRDGPREVKIDQGIHIHREALVGITAARGRHGKDIARRIVLGRRSPALDDLADSRAPALLDVSAQELQERSAPVDHRRELAEIRVSLPRAEP